MHAFFTDTTWDKEEEARPAWRRKEEETRPGRREEQKEGKEQNFSPANSGLFFVECRLKRKAKILDLFLGKLIPRGGD